MKLLVFMLCVWLKLGVPNTNKEKKIFYSFSYSGCFNHLTPSKKYTIEIDSNRIFYLLEEQKNTILLSKTKKTPSLKFILPKEEYAAFLKKLNTIDFSSSSVYMYDKCNPVILVNYTYSIAELILNKQNAKADELVMSLILLKDKYKILQKSGFLNPE